MCIGRKLKSFLCNWKSLCFAHGGGCCCNQTSVSQGRGNSAGMMLSREVLKFWRSKEGEEKSGGFLCRPGCDEGVTDLSSDGTVGTVIASHIHCRMCWMQITEDTLAAQVTSGLDLSCLPCIDIECFLPM